jgi:hypothetical protein
VLSGNTMPMSRGRLTTTAGARRTLPLLPHSGGERTFTRSRLRANFDPLETFAPIKVSHASVVFHLRGCTSHWMEADRKGSRALSGLLGSGWRQCWHSRALQHAAGASCRLDQGSWG